MKKKALPIESILLLVSFIVTGLAVLFIVKPQAQQHPKFIKWSKESNLQGILSNTARRMFPILSENKDLVIIKPLGSSVENYQIQQEFQTTTNISISLDSSDENRLILNPEKDQTIILNLKFYELDLSKTIPKSFFDYDNLIKITDELILSAKEDKTYVFTLYQTGKKTYNLDILNFN